MTSEPETDAYSRIVAYRPLYGTDEEEQEPGNVAPRSVTKKKQYPADFKLQVISSAKTTNNTKAAKMHGVDSIRSLLDSIRGLLCYPEVTIRAYSRIVAYSN